MKLNNHTCFVVELTSTSTYTFMACTGKKIYFHDTHDKQYNSRAVLLCYVSMTNELYLTVRNWGLKLSVTGELAAIICVMNVQC